MIAKKVRPEPQHAEMQVACNEQGLALLGYLKNVKPTTEAQYVLKVEDMN